jgi:CheY-like chemotaxis protein
VLDTASLRHTQVEVIANRLQQVLNNLVGNAIKYNRRGGSVLVSAQLGADARVGLTVADNGIGMSAEQVAGLFRPFNRLGHREAVGGFGYGLVVVHRLVLAMGGTIHVNSEPGAGTVFTVWLRAAVHQGALDTLADVSLDSAHGALPAHDASGTGAADGPDRGVPRDGRAGSRLLLVDDDELNHVLIRHYAGSVPGLEVDGAYDADTALAAWQLHQRNGGVQLLVLDLHLGRASGEQLLERLRAAGYGGPAVAYTGDAAAVVASGDPRRGFCAVWEKPMRLEDFRRRVPALLGNTSWH